MNDRIEHRSQARPRTDGDDAGPAVACEIRLHSHTAVAARMVCCCDGMVCRLNLTRQPGGDWVARLLLVPGEYELLLRITRDPGRAPRQGDWPVSFRVPAIRHPHHAEAQMRIWIDDPHDAPHPTTAGRPGAEGPR